MEEKKLILDNELNAEGGTAMYNGGWMDFDVVVPASDTAALAGGQRQRGAIGQTELVILSDNEADNVSAGMVAGLEDISGGVLYIGEHKGEIAGERQLRASEPLFSMTAEASDLSRRLPMRSLNSES